MNRVTKQDFIQLGCSGQIFRAEDLNINNQLVVTILNLCRYSKQGKQYVLYSC